AAVDAGVCFRAVVTDCTYGENPPFEEALWAAGLPFVFGLTPSTGAWAPADAAHTTEEAAGRLRSGVPDAPGDWTAVERRFRDGRAETLWAVDLVVAEADVQPHQQRDVVPPRQHVLDGAEVDLEPRLAPGPRGLLARVPGEAERDQEALLLRPRTAPTVSTAAAPASASSRCRRSGFQLARLAPGRVARHRLGVPSGIPPGRRCA